MQDVIYIQRMNTLGGVVPTGMFTLPAFGNIPNALLDIPCALFFVTYFV